jgi:phage shock protein A
MLKRLYNMFLGFLGLFIKGLERNNPEALLENERENLRKQIASFNDALATHAGMVEKLGAQTKRLETEERDLRAKIPALIAAGKRDVAGQLAVKLQSVDAQHDQVLARLEDTDRKYKELVKARDASVTAATRKIEELSVGLNDMKIKKAAAELCEMATGMITNIGSSGDSLSRIGDMIDNERSKAAGRARVAGDSLAAGGAIIDIDGETALAEAALLQFETDYVDPLKEKKPAKAKRSRAKQTL